MRHRRTDDDARDISLVTPVHKSERPWLQAAIASVLEQANPHLELWIADDASRQSTCARRSRLRPPTLASASPTAISRAASRPHRIRRSRLRQGNRWLHP